jgi:hypothetical protein
MWLACSTRPSEYYAVAIKKIERLFQTPTNMPDRQCLPAYMWIANSLKVSLTRGELVYVLPTPTGVAVARDRLFQILRK